MGLDVYAVRPSDADVTGHAALPRPVTLRWLLPERLEPFEAVPRTYPEGLMWPSDSDVTGFRGGAYRTWVDKVLGVSLYELADPAEVAELSGRLDAWLASAQADGASEVELAEGSSIPLAGVEALASFLRAAADQKLWLYPDY